MEVERTQEILGEMRRGFAKEFANSLIGRATFQLTDPWRSLVYRYRLCVPILYLLPWCKTSSYKRAASKEKNFTHNKTQERNSNQSLNLYSEVCVSVYVCVCSYI